MRSAPWFCFLGGGKKSHLSGSHPCLRKRAVSHHVFRVQTIVSLPPGRRWARADAVWWSAAGTGERSPNLLDGALMNAAFSVLPMVPPCSFKALSLVPVCRVFASRARGSKGPWGPFSLLHHTSEPCKARFWVHVVCCLCIAGLSVKSRPPGRLPDRHTPLRAASWAVELTSSPPPAPVDYPPPKKKAPDWSLFTCLPWPRESLTSSLARQARQ